MELRLNLWSFYKFPIRNEIVSANPCDALERSPATGCDPRDEEGLREPVGRLHDHFSLNRSASSEPPVVSPVL